MSDDLTCTFPFSGRCTAARRRSIPWPLQSVGRIRSWPRRLPWRSGTRASCHLEEKTQVEEYTVAPIVCLAVGKAKFLSIVQRLQKWIGAPERS